MEVDDEGWASYDGGLRGASSSSGVVRPYNTQFRRAIEMR